MTDSEATKLWDDENQNGEKEQPVLSTATPRLPLLVAGIFVAAIVLSVVRLVMAISKIRQWVVTVGVWEHADEVDVLFVVVGGLFGLVGIATNIVLLLRKRRGILLGGFFVLLLVASLGNSAIEVTTVSRLGSEDWFQRIAAITLIWGFAVAIYVCALVFAARRLRAGGATVKSD